MGTKQRNSEEEGEADLVKLKMVDLEMSGGAKRDRTADLYNAIVALSQLSYSPVQHSPSGVTRPAF